MNLGETSVDKCKHFLLLWEMREQGYMERTSTAPQDHRGLPARNPLRKLLLGYQATVSKLMFTPHRSQWVNQ
jgi:hypothetical protein